MKEYPVNANTIEALRRTARGVQIKPEGFLDRLHFDSWRQKHSASWSYSSSFRSLLVTPEDIDRPANSTIARLQEESESFLNFDFIKKLVKEKSQDKELLALDLMSYGAVFRNLGVKSLAVALRDRRNFLHKRRDQQLESELLEGDIRSAKTWHSIKDWLKGDERFDIIIARPWGALSKIPQDLIFYQYAFAKMYEMLTDCEGILLCQFHPEKLEEVSCLTDKINDTDSLEARCSITKIRRQSPRGAFILVKHPQAPKKLEIPMETFQSSS